MKKTYKMIFVFIISAAYLNAQSVKIFGYVKDSLSGETLVSANVYSADKQIGCATNNFGFYNISLERNSLANFKISYAGYKTVNLSILMRSDTTINFLLSPITLQQVEIKSTKLNVIGHGVLSLPVDRLRVVPSLAGETDLIKALTFLPGIATGAEGTSAIYVRGGTPDQNLMLLDGATVYNTSHLFGYFSVFNPLAVKSINVYKGGFPARYGGRLSSVLDITMKEGNNQEYKTETTVGLLNSSFITEGPIKKNKSSYMVSGRGSYLGLFSYIPRINYDKTKIRDNASYNSFFIYDFNAKVNFDLTPTQKLFVSSYIGQDIYGNGEKLFGTETRTTTNWANQTVSLRYTNIIKPNFFANVLLNFNRYKLFNGGTQMHDTTFTDYTFEKTSLIRDYVGKVSFDYDLNQHAIKFGGEFGIHQFEPNNLSVTSHPKDIDVYAESPVSKYSALSSTIFVEDNYSITPKLSVNVGVRLLNFNVNSSNYNSLEPRFSAKYQINETNTFEASYTKMAQYLHLLTFSNAGAPNDIWAPSTDKIPLERAEQIALSYTKNFTDVGWSLQLESYYKNFSDLIDYKSGTNLYSTKVNWEDLVATHGVGRAYGFEFLLRKDVGRLNGWMSYTWAKSERQFTDINNGNWYPEHYDRRHNFNIVAQYKISDRWTINSNFVYQSGYAINLPDALYLNDFGFITPFYFSRNNARAPAYNRLDVSITKTRFNKKRNEIKWTYGIYNVYGYKNPYAVEYAFNSQLIKNSSNAFIFSGYIKVESFFNFIPGVSYSIKFK